MIDTKGIFSVSLLGLVLVQISLCDFSRYNLCDHVNNTQAICRRKYIVSAKMDSLPRTIRRLDLDYNQISVIENNAFMYMPELENLTISHNIIQSIYLDAFIDLTYLKHLNLSNNRLEIFDNKIVEKNLKLQTMDLSGNNFIYLDKLPLLYSVSLKELYLREAKLVHINSLFDELPNLELLDLSRNLLVSLEIPNFISLRNIKFINFENNYLKCDKPTQHLIDWLSKQSIKYQALKCAMTKKDKMFERMEMRAIDTIGQMEIEEKNTTVANQSVVNPETINNEIMVSMQDKSYFRKCLLMDHEFVCHLLENCKESLNCDKYIEEKTKQMKVTFYFVIGIFMIGMIIGAVIALCCCQAIISCQVDKQRRQLMRQDRRRNRGNHGRNTTRESEAVLIPRQDAENSQALVEVNPFHEFVNDIFSRRRPRRYISTISYHGTNLVRHLSRSSMNLLRRSQYRAENANRATPMATVVPNGDTASRSRPDPNYDYGIDLEQDSSINCNNEFVLNELMRQRSYTPPPDYEHCVSKPNTEFDKTSL